MKALLEFCRLIEAWIILSVIAGILAAVLYVNMNHWHEEETCSEVVMRDGYVSYEACLFSRSWALLKRMGPGNARTRALLIFVMLESFSFLTAYMSYTAAFTWPIFVFLAIYWTVVSSRWMEGYNGDPRDPRNSYQSDRGE